MILERLYHRGLAQATYLIGCAETGEALVVDPNRDVQSVIDAADAHGLRVTHVTETHIQADFLSGVRALAQRTGAKLLLSGEGGEAWRYGFPDEVDVVLRDGDDFRIGNIRIEVLHTPGHTPEHLCLVVTDTAAADRPLGLLSGDCLFVGDVGRPDLLERAAGQAGTMREAARELYRSLGRLLEVLPDFVQVWPGHGAGSACGKSLGAVPQSTIGYERLYNPALQHADEAAFVDAVLADQPEPPAYFAEMKRINRAAPPREALPPVPPRLSDEDALGEIRAGATVVDVRAAEEFAAAHVRGSYHAPAASRSFLIYAGSVLPLDRELLLLGAPAAAAEAARELALIGIDRISGVVSPRLLARATTVGVREYPPEPLQEGGEGRPLVIDVRNPSEYAAGHLPHGVNLPLGGLREAAAALPKERPVVVHCESGVRAMVAIGALEAIGFEDVRHLAGDLVAWRREGRPLARDATAQAAAD